jgi:phosphate transport system protein
MSSHFNQTMEDLRRRLLTMANIAADAVRTAAQALITGNPELAQQVFVYESQTDEEEVVLERLAISICALHQPVASDLRQVFTAVKVNMDLERMGDSAANIAETVQHLSTVTLPVELRQLAEASVKQVQDTLQCLAQNDVQRARAICQSDDLIDALYTHLLQAGQSGQLGADYPIAAQIAIIMAAKNFERIGDHCCNVAENVLYAAQGDIMRHHHEPHPH